MSSPSYAEFHRWNDYNKVHEQPRQEDSQPINCGWVGDKESIAYSIARDLDFSKFSRRDLVVIYSVTLSVADCQQCKTENDFEKLWYHEYKKQSGFHKVEIYRKVKYGYSYPIPSYHSTSPSNPVQYIGGGKNAGAKEFAKMFLKDGELYLDEFSDDDVIMIQSINLSIPIGMIRASDGVDELTVILQHHIDNPFMFEVLI